MNDNIEKKLFSMRILYYSYIENINKEQST